LFRRFLDSPWPYFAAAGVLLVVAVFSQIEIEGPARSSGSVEDIAALRERDDLNVVFILIDTLRADRLGAYGYERNTSEVMDSLAKHGIVFRNVLSQSSWTKASMASIWTGTYPANNGVVRFNHVLPVEAVLPAELLKEAGFRTAGIWRNGWVAPNFGFGQGFDFYLNPKPGRERARVQGDRPGGASARLKGTDEDLLTSAFEFIDNFARERFFLYLHFMDLHQYVYDEAAAIFGSGYSDVYDQSIHWTDRLIGLLLNRIEEVAGLDETIVVIASDHGEAFQEHGNEGHAKNLFAEAVHVPFLISLPFALDPGVVVEERVMNVDVWPTVLDLVGVKPLEKTDGRSLVPLIVAAGRGREEEAKLDRQSIAHLDRRWGTKDKTDPLVSVTEGDARLMWSAKGDRDPLFFDLKSDPGELDNIYDANDPVAERLVQAAKQYYETGESPWGVDAYSVELDELRLNQLRALGYEIE